MVELEEKPRVPHAVISIFLPMKSRLSQRSLWALLLFCVRVYLRIMWRAWSDGERTHTARRPGSAPGHGPPKVGWGGLITGCTIIVLPSQKHWAPDTALSYEHPQVPFLHTSPHFIFLDTPFLYEVLLVSHGHRPHYRPEKSIRRLEEQN